MLVLSRKQGERICIGGNVYVSIQRVSGNRVVLGVDAPPEVSVMRDELQRKMGSKSDSLLDDFVAQSEAAAL